MSADVLQRFAAQPARYEPFDRCRIDRFFAVREEPCRRSASDIGQKHVDVARVYAAGLRHSAKPRPKRRNGFARHALLRLAYLQLAGFFAQYLDRPFPLELSPPGTNTGDGGLERLQDDGVHELPVKESLPEQPDQGAW